MNLFDRWWKDEGSGMKPQPLVGGRLEDHSEHVHRMTRIAWLNGEYTLRKILRKMDMDRARQDAKITVYLTALASLSVAGGKLYADGVVRQAARRASEVTEADLPKERGS